MFPPGSYSNRVHMNNWRAGASQPSHFNGRFIYLYISGAGRHHTVMFYVAPNFMNVSSILHISVFRLFCVYVYNIHVFRMLLPTTPPGFRNSWKTNPVTLEPSKQTTEVSTFIQTVGFKLIQDSELQIPETLLEGGTSLYHLRFSADK